MSDLILEKKQLDEMIAKLEAFRKTDAFKEAPLVYREMMIILESVLEMYSESIEERGCSCSPDRAK